MLGHGRHRGAGNTDPCYPPTVDSNGGICADMGDLGAHLVTGNRFKTDDRGTTKDLGKGTGGPSWQAPRGLRHSIACPPGRCSPTPVGNPDKDGASCAQPAVAPR